MTSLEYLLDTYKFISIATVKSIEALDLPVKGHKYKILLDSTIFHPQGGGQPSDVGTITIKNNSIAFKVGFVRMGLDGEVEHFGDTDVQFDLADSGSETACLSVDKEIRLASSISHSSGHLIDAAVSKYNLQGADFLDWRPTKGYHFSDGCYVEYEGNLLNNEKAVAIIPILNNIISDFIREEIPTESICVPKEEAIKYCKELDLSTYPSIVRLVQIGGQFTPCGGTHVANTSELRGLKIDRIKGKKGCIKVSYSVA